MPITRSAFRRYRLIDEALSQHPYKYSKKRLFALCQEECGIRSISSLEKDIQTLREDHNAPIAYCKKRDGYYYADPSFRLLKLMLSPDDMEAFERAGEVLKATHGTAIVEELNNALKRVRQNLDIIREVTSDSVDTTAVFAKDQAITGNQQSIAILIRAINKDHQVTFDYLKHDSTQVRSHTIHPLKLREVRDSWYLIGYDEAAKHEKTFGIDRISHLQVTELKCNIPAEVLDKVEQLFDNVYGITYSHQPVEEIWLSFTPLIGKYIKAKPIHKTQKEIEITDTSYIIQLNLIINHDLMMLLRSYGPDLKILRPQDLAKKFTKEIKNTLAQYSDEDT